MSDTEVPSVEDVLLKHHVVQGAPALGVIVVIIILFIVGWVAGYIGIPSSIILLCGIVAVVGSVVYAYKNRWAIRTAAYPKIGLTDTDLTVKMTEVQQSYVSWTRTANRSWGSSKFERDVADATSSSKRLAELRVIIGNWRDKKVDVISVM